MIDTPTTGSRKRVSFCPTVEDNERPTGQSLEEKRLEEKMSHSLHKLAADAIVKYLTPHYKEGKFSSKVGLFIHHTTLGPLHKTMGNFTINGISPNYGNYHSNTAP